LYLKNGGQELDFIVLGSDGIFDKVSTEEICMLVWNVVKDNQNDPNINLHQICGKCADEILRLAAKQKTMDNISIVMIGFKKLQDYLDRCRTQQVPQIGKSNLGAETHSLYSGGKLSEKTDIVSQKSQT
jgi:serine/threonine protein phosphatase PrpC